MGFKPENIDINVNLLKLVKLVPNVFKFVKIHLIEIMFTNTYLCIIAKFINICVLKCLLLFSIPYELK